MSRFRASRSMAAILVIAVACEFSHGETGVIRNSDHQVSGVWPNFTAAELYEPTVDSLYARTESSMTVQARTEPDIAIGLKDAHNMVAAFPDVVRGSQGHAVSTCTRRYSFDAGVTWNTSTPEPPLQTEWGRCSNTRVAAGPGGLFYSVTMTYDDNEEVQTENLSVSRDGGRTWDTGAVITHSDRGDEARKFRRPDTVCGPKRIAVDTREGSPYLGRFYYITCEDKQNINGKQGYALMLRFSADQGRTLSKPKLIVYGLGADPDLGWFLPAEIVVGQKGSLSVVYTSEGPDSQYHIGLVQSSDGGMTFGKARVWNRTLFPALRKGIIPGPDWGRHTQWQEVYDDLSVDAAQTTDGKLWIVYSEVADAAIKCLPAPHIRFCIGANVSLVTTNDGGMTWSQPIDFAGANRHTDQWLPNVHAHPDGTVSFAWLDKRLNPDNLGYDAYYTNTRDGKSFLPPVRLSGVSSRLIRPAPVPIGKNYRYNLDFLGDWLGSAAVGDRFSAVWSDMRAPVAEDKPIPKEIWAATLRFCDAQTGGSAPRRVCAL